MHIATLPVTSDPAGRLRGAIALAFALAMPVLGAGCATPGGAPHLADGDAGEGASAPTRLHQAVPKDKLHTAARKLAAEGLKALDAREYGKASDLFNMAVKTDMTNSYLHFLNGVAYQMRGLDGESSLLTLAEQGFDMAVQFDGSNWLARHHGGLLAMQQRDFAKAQRKLAEAALYAPKSPELLYDLAVASYYNQDPRVAAAALEGLRAVLGDDSRDPRLWRASAIVAAALNDEPGAKAFLARLRAATGTSGATDVTTAEYATAEDRVDTWLGAHQRGLVLKTQFPSGNGGFPSGGAGAGSFGNGAPPKPSFPPFPPTSSDGTSGFGANAGAFPGTPPGSLGGRSDFVEKQMAVVDVSILSTEEDNTHAMGVNLLDGLKIQFGNPASLTPGFSRAVNATRTAADAASQSTVITRLIQVPALTYTLNIANANAKRNEVLARPTLVALGNQPSNFFSGQDIVGAAVSGGQGSSVQIQKEVGVKLSVTPEFLPDGLIKLNVVAERTFLAIPSTSVKFDFRLDTNKTMVNANVVMRFGETLILSGLSERDQSKDRDGVPVLQDVPIVQYLFSRNLTRDYYKSVLILLTPRRAQYTDRDDAVVAAERADLSPSERAVAEFEDKYRPWFKPLPNVAEIVKALEGGSLYREFRTGDLASSWQRVSGHEDRLKAAMGFLFY